eukprot:4905357-Prymnesium_polylepis.1
MHHRARRGAARRPPSAARSGQPRAVGALARAGPAGQVPPASRTRARDRNAWRERARANLRKR